MQPGKYLMTTKSGEKMTVVYTRGDLLEDLTHQCHRSLRSMQDLGVTFEAIKEKSAESPAEQPSA